VFRRDRVEGLSYAEEVLLPKADLDEKKQHIVELEGQVKDVARCSPSGTRLRKV
jgi:NADH dehydrogenase/NADH:ubiquinone oxidoreductase subunit G